MYIINQELKMPLKAYEAIVSHEEFVPFYQVLVEAGHDITWSYNFNDPEYRPGSEKSHTTFISSFDSEDAATYMRYHSIYPSLGDVVVIPQPDNSIKLMFVYGVEDFWENEVCAECFTQLFFELDDGEETVKPEVEKMLTTFPIITHDQSRDNDFSMQTCDCCGSKLGGQRHFLICLKDT